MEDGIEQHMRTFVENRVLVFGTRLGQKVVAILNRSPSVVAFCAESRANDPDAVKAEIHKCGATHVMCFTHSEDIRTTDYLENLNENLRDNLFAPLTIADTCADHNIHYTYISDYVSDDDRTSQRIIQRYTDRLIHRRNNVLIVQVRIDDGGSLDKFLLSVVDLVIKRFCGRIT